MHEYRIQNVPEKTTQLIVSKAINDKPVFDDAIVKIIEKASIDQSRKVLQDL